VPPLPAKRSVGNNVQVEPRLAIPIHYDDDEAFKSPLEDFVAAVDGAGLADRVRYRRDVPASGERVSAVSACRLPIAALDWHHQEERQCP
jgi:hypothetical protein